MVQELRKTARAALARGLKGFGGARTPENAETAGWTRSRELVCVSFRANLERETLGFVHSWPGVLSTVSYSRAITLLTRDLALSR